MQLKDQKSEPTPIEKVSNLADLAEETLDDQTISKPIIFPVAEQVDTQVYFPKKNIKLGILIRLSIGFAIGLGGIIFTLPSLLNCSNKAMESEGINNIGVIIRGQEAFYLKNNKFTNSMPELGVGISPQTIHYQYSIQTDRQFVVNYAQSKKPNLKSYLGVVFVGIVPKSDRTSTTKTILCEVSQPQPLANIMPVYQNGTVSCPQGTKQI